MAASPDGDISEHRGGSEQDWRGPALVRHQKQWRWLPMLSSRPSTQSSQTWSPLQCLPAVSDLIRLSARSKARNSLDDKKDARAILSSGGANGAVEPLKLHIGTSGHDEQPQEGLLALNENPGACGGEEVVRQAAFQATVSSSPSNGELPIVHTNFVDEVSEEFLDPVVLDVGFAKVELKEFHQAWPKYEFYIVANDGLLTRDGAVALLEYLDFVLRLPEVVSHGFVLTYDLRNCSCPQLDLVSWIMHYISDPQREEAWHERCVCWKVVVPPGMYFSMAQSALSFLFTVCPPKCRVFLLTDLDTTKAESWICYKPEDLAEASPSMLSTIGSGLLETFFPAYPNPISALERPVISSPSQAPVVQEVMSSEETNIFSEAVEGPEDRAGVSAGQRAGAQDQVAQSPPSRTCADSITTPFVTIHQGFDQISGMGYLRVKGHNAAMSDEGLKKVMDFMDDFVSSANAQQGFSITYDLRRLGVPSMSMLMQVAEWGNQSERQAAWNRLNKSCKVVISSGLRFSLCKGILKSFFYMCPPVCRTFLLTDPDESEATATVFDPVDPCSKHEQDSQSEEPETHSDDGGSSCGNSADVSESTAASGFCGDTSLDTGEEAKEIPSGDVWKQWKLGLEATD